MISSESLASTPGPSVSVMNEDSKDSFVMKDDQNKQQQQVMVMLWLIMD